MATSLCRPHPGKLLLFFKLLLLLHCESKNTRQGSAAMSLRCGGICNDHFVANLVLSPAVKEF